MKKRKKGLLKLVIHLALVISIIISMVPVKAFAEDTGNQSEESIKIVFDNSFTKWDEVYLYYFNAPTSINWPGIKMDPVEGRENVYEAKVPKGTENIIVNNNQGEQSQDMNDVVDGGEYIGVQKEGKKVAVLRKGDDGSIPGEPEDDGDESKKTPKQVNVHVGDDGYSVNITFTNTSKIDSKVTVNKKGSTEKMVFEGTREYSFMTQKYHYSVKVTGLDANTEYEYTVSEGNTKYTGSFKTAPKEGSKDTIKFAYIADTQVKKATDAKALGATLNKVNNIDNLGFVYLAGDVTDNAGAEDQWEMLFNNSGLYPNGGEALFGNNLIAVTQGNHDVSTLSKHITTPSKAGDAVYSFDYGPVKFIVLNLEIANGDNEARDKEKAFLEAEVADAKKNGQWTVVGFHKSIYTGASHIVDGDVREARKYWSPILSGLDVDVVLQGHDHVYARGFVNENGVNPKLSANEDGSYSKTENLPLYMVGGHAGGLKWYNTKDYTVEEGDLLTPNYEFLDVNSAKDGKQGEQTYTVFEVSNNEIKFNTYMFKYDQELDQITTEDYLYDTLSLKRETFNIALPKIEGANLELIEAEADSNSVVSLAKGSNLSFKVNLEEGYTNSNVKVSVNGNEIEPVDGVYTIENISDNCEVKIDGITKNVIENDNTDASNNKVDVNKDNSSDNDTNEVKSDKTGVDNNNKLEKLSTTKTKTGDNNGVYALVFMLICASSIAVMKIERKKIVNK